MTEITAQLNNYRQSPRKVRLVAALPIMQPSTAPPWTRELFRCIGELRRLVKACENIPVKVKNCELRSNPSILQSCKMEGSPRASSPAGCEGNTQHGTAGAVRAAPPFCSPTKWSAVLDLAILPDQGQSPWDGTGITNYGLLDINRPTGILSVEAAYRKGCLTIA